MGRWITGMNIPIEGLPLHLTNDATKGMPHEGGEYTCWCVESVAVLQAEVVSLLAKLGRTQTWLDEFQGKLAEEEIATLTYGATNRELRKELAHWQGAVAESNEHWNAEVERLRMRVEAAERLIEVVRAREVGTSGGVGAAFEVYDALGRQ
jgi:hypothetical protein